MSYFTDERGKRSLGRVLLILWTLLGAAAIAAEIASGLLAGGAAAFVLANPTWVAWTTGELALVGWVGGRVVSENLAKWVGGAIATIAQAKRDVRLPSAADDERRD